ncbi:MAG: hypothetical protein K2Y16_05355 [Burkholderiales bacterium]|nr:hypothetical protein [Burkholderiales bacterium]MBY0576199.1 hypothetical protein [Gallionellaceae bacterium]
MRFTLMCAVPRYLRAICGPDELSAFQASREAHTAADQHALAQGRLISKQRIRRLSYRAHERATVTPRSLLFCVPGSAAAASRHGNTLLELFRILGAAGKL